MARPVHSTADQDCDFPILLPVPVCTTRTPLVPEFPGTCLCILKCAMTGRHLLSTAGGVPGTGYPGRYAYLPVFQQSTSMQHMHTGRC